jgi:hypothetical protein
MRWALVLAIAVAMPASASARTPTTSVAKKKTIAKKKTTAKKAPAKKKTKKVATRHAAKKMKKKAVRPKVAKKPLIAVASKHGDGRVRYGKDNMPPGFAWPATKAMKTASKACEQTLTDAGIVFEPAPPEGYIVDPIHVPAMEVAGISLVRAYGKGPVTFDCQLIRVLAKVGPELHQLGVRQIKFGSVYRNTPVRVHGETKPILSRHALGIAMDIKSFVDDKGRVADVELDYLKGDPLLHAIEEAVNRSTEFRIVLTPGNDPLSHYDHFHIEASVDFTAFR